MCVVTIPPICSEIFILRLFNMVLASLGAPFFLVGRLSIIIAVCAVPWHVEFVLSFLRSQCLAGWLAGWLQSSRSRIVCVWHL